MVHIVRSLISLKDGSRWFIPVAPLETSHGTLAPSTPSFTVKTCSPRPVTDTDFRMGPLPLPLGHRFQCPTPACQYRLESRLAQKPARAPIVVAVAVAIAVPLMTRCNSVCLLLPLRCLLQTVMVSPRGEPVSVSWAHRH